MALRVGEPFGAILLALAVTVIELGRIFSIMLGDRPEPTLMRVAARLEVLGPG